MNPSGWSKLALIGAAVVLLALGGCGRKRGLDPPPQAAVQQPGSGDEAPAEGFRNPLTALEVDEDDRPVAAKGQKRRLIIDRILD